MEKIDVVKESFGRFLTGFSLSKALLEDYVKVIAKFENVTEQEVKDRIMNRSQEIYTETLEKQIKQTEEAGTA